MRANGIDGWVHLVVGITLELHHITLRENVQQFVDGRIAFRHSRIDVNGHARFDRIKRRGGIRFPRAVNCGARGENLRARYPEISIACREFVRVVNNVDGVRICHSLEQIDGNNGAIVDIGEFVILVAHADDGEKGERSHAQGDANESCENARTDFHIAKHFSKWLMSDCYKTNDEMKTGITGPTLCCAQPWRGEPEPRLIPHCPTCSNTSCPSARG